MYKNAVSKNSKEIMFTNMNHSSYEEIMKHSVKETLEIESHKDIFISQNMDNINDIFYYIKDNYKDKGLFNSLSFEDFVKLIKKPIKVEPKIVEEEDYFETLGIQDMEY